MTIKTALLSIIAMLPICCFAQIQLTDADLTNAYTKVSITRQGNLCHDPSIFIDNITNPSSPVYYIYGSHLGHGKTTAAKNYQQWSTWAAYENTSSATNSLFANTSGIRINYANAYNTHTIKEVKNSKGETVSFGNFNAHSWQYTGYNISGNQWAADAIYNKTMKKWCMYMSINGDKWCSVIVCLTSNSPEGPWIYQGPVVFSGFQGTYAHVGFTATNDFQKTDYTIATGETTLAARYKVSDKWGTYWPNCIDPCVFYDENDDLWMSYGSWSGGIFMLKLDKTNGLRDYTYKYPYQVNGSTTTPGSANANCTSDPYFGKKIAGGYYVSGEASYIEKIGKYYYLFMSYGGLDTKGGYQMRIFRSEKADGPYKDPYGTSAIYNSYVMNYSSTARDARGMLLMGGYKWEFMPYAEICQGHNSAMTDHLGRSFVVYHTRSTVGHEGHEVRVHQLFLNQDGWIMAAPFEFSGETITNNDIASKASIDDSEIAGNYQFMRHEYNQNTANLAYETPVDIELTADGKIIGGASGTWTRTAGTDFITLTISGVNYKGVLVRQTIDYSNIKALCISACSSSSGSLSIGQKSFTYQQNVWAVKTDYKAAIKYTLDKTVVPFTNGKTLTSNVTLPSGLLGAKIVWTSSDENLMTSKGVVKGKGSVVMTMQIVKDGYAYTKQYNLNIDAGGVAPVPTYYPVSTSKNLTAAWWQNFSKDNYILKAGETAKFRFYNYSDKVNNYDNWCLYGANTTHGGSGYTEYFGVRCDNWDNTSGSNTGCTSDFNWDTFKTDMDGSLVDIEVEYTSGGVFTMKSTITTTAKKVYNYSYTKTISTKPSQLTIFFVNEKSYIDGSSLETADGINLPATIRRPDNTIYNLSGQRVGSNYKGIVIKNGKRFINR